MSSSSFALGKLAPGAAADQDKRSKTGPKPERPFAQYLPIATFQEKGIDFSIGEAEHKEMLEMVAIFESEQKEKNSKK